MVVERALSSQEGSGDESVCANAVAELVAAEVKLLADAQQVVRTGKQELAQLAVQRLREETTTTEQTPPADTAAAARCLQSGEVVDAVAADIDRAADGVVRAVSVQRVEAAEMGIVQFRREQQQSVMVRALKERGSYQGQRVFTDEAGLINIETEEGEARVVLPAVYWALAFKEAHDSIWAGHLRGPQTFERVRQLYWWPKMREAVQHWVSACQDCGSRKARPKAVVQPLRSVRTGAVCDRWAIDVAGPLPVTANGHRYVIAAVEYTTRYAVAAAVPEHTAKSIARFLMDKVVLVYGPMREIMMDGAVEFSIKATGELLDLLQVKQSTPDDWDDFLPCALYAYNSSKHATHGYQPNELMMGRKLRTPADLLRRNRLAHPHRTLDAYHEVLLRDLETANELAALALQKEQARQAMYYNQRNVRSRSDYRAGQLVWMYRPARGPKITKFGHKWIGPGQVIEQAGYDNYRIKMLESGHELRLLPLEMRKQISKEKEEQK
ncbi:hypothetical protein PF011_g21301 [Phytophthora fragariae]|uniref:Integrase catalytic domain-containing protein n=1 Tax=Phytophthora fragariae TaxID=53985 RepID=A0A6A3IN94_9STRA|nr:hypothetical protein PF011_g21301 [Phytophthora fragariae]